MKTKKFFALLLTLAMALSLLAGCGSKPAHKETRPEKTPPRARAPASAATPPPENTPTAPFTTSGAT